MNRRARVSSRRHRAYHEAGHAVIAHVLGMQVNCASIKVDWEAGVGGYAEHLPPHAHARLFVEGRDGVFRRNARGERLAQMANYRKVATVLFAGADAACRAVGCWDANSPGLAGSERDLDQAEAI